jgi:hypothetical protein
MVRGSREHGIIAKRVYVTERFGKTVWHLWHTHTVRVRRALMRSNEAIFDAATFHVRQTRFGQRARFLVSRFTTSEVTQKASLLERRPWLGGYVSQRSRQCADILQICERRL